MADRTEAALELALQVLDAVKSGVLLPGDIDMPGSHQDIRDTIAGALASIRQQPSKITGADMYMRLQRELRAAGSETALASKIDIRRQSLSDVLSGRREAGPAVLAYLGLRRVTTVHYEHADIAPKPEPVVKPRSERRQRAWDMQPRLQQGASA